MKLLATYIFLFFSLNSFAKEIDFNKPVLSDSNLDKSFYNEFKSISFDSVKFNEPSLLILRENDSDFMFTQEFLFFQNVDFQPTHKDFSNEFLNYCGPLTDGLYVNRNASDVIISRVMDDFINNYLVKRFLFPKNKD